MTALDLVAEAQRLGLMLWAKENGNIGFKPARLCPPEFIQGLSAHKREMLELLRMRGIRWIEVYSKRLNETIFFCHDEDTKEILIEAGAEYWSTYTRNELLILVAQNRLKPLTQAELRKVHEIKRTFGAKIAE